MEGSDTSYRQMRCAKVGRSLQVVIKVETRLLEAGTLVIVITRLDSKHPTPTAVFIHGHDGISAIITHVIYSSI
jgi:hypothetical protein